MAGFRELYPFESHWLDLPAGRLHYVDEGEGAPILCMHGNPTWSFYYRRLIQHFSSTHRVIAPDHIGCGFSDKPQDFSYRLEDHIRNAERLVEALDLGDVTLVVHDWGGPTGFGVAGRHPERFARFLVLNTSAFFVDRIPWRIAICKLPVFGPLAVRGLNAFARAATVMTVEHAERMTPEVRAGYLKPYDSWANRIATLRFVQDIPLKPSHPSWETLAGVEANLEELRGKPMRICWGMRDWCFSPRFLEEWERRFPEAEVTRLEDAGHYVLEDAHERILPILEELVVCDGEAAEGA